MAKQTAHQIERLLIRDLENAAMNLHKRNYYLYRVFSKYVAFNQLHAVLFVRFSPLYDNGYDVIHVGIEKEAVQLWLKPLLTQSIQLTIENMMHVNWPTQLGPGKINSYDNGILIEWPQQQQNQLDKLLFEGLKAISFVEQKEYDYFYEIGTPFEPDIAQSIQEKDKDGLVELLSLTKSITSSDITFWGETNSKQVEVDMHIGSRDGSFGFLLPLGKGIGGLAAQNKKVLQVADYQNCEYRYGDVSVAVDQEKIRTVFALPLKDEQQNTSGILYVGNRTINPIPLEKKFLLLRLGNQLEPIVKRKEIAQFFTRSDRKTFFKQKKAELREIGQTAKQLNKVERWLADFLKGDALLIDSEGKPYCHEEKMVQRKHTKQFYSYPLTYNERNLGKLYIWTNVELPLQNEWPDLIDDVIHTIYIINERNERYYHLAELERSQWLYNMMQPSSHAETQYEKGIKLRVPIDHGEVWAVYWNKNTDILSLEEKMQLEEISLFCLRQPIYFKSTSGFIMFDRAMNCSPEELRNKLLTVLPVETWIIHGATYSSFENLRDILLQLQSLLESAKREKKNDYVLTFESFGLENLLSNPRVADELQSFAQYTLEPVIKYDKEHQSELTKTLALSLIYKSPSKVAKKLFIHPNTVHYRVNRAKQLLNVDFDDVSNEIALTFAAYTWLFEQNISISQFDILED